MKKTAICALILNFIGAAAYAGTCELTTHREACNGMKDKAFAPYKKASNPTGDPTVETPSADSADACKKIAEGKYKIARKRELSKKVTTVKFDGAEVTTLTDQSDCK